MGFYTLVSSCYSGIKKENGDADNKELFKVGMFSGCKNDGAFRVETLWHQHLDLHEKESKIHFISKKNEDGTRVLLSKGECQKILYSVEYYLHQKLMGDKFYSKKHKNFHDKSMSGHSEWFASNYRKEIEKELKSICKDMGYECISLSLDDFREIREAKNGKKIKPELNNAVAKILKPIRQGISVFKEKDQEIKSSDLYIVENEAGKLLPTFENPEKLKIRATLPYSEESENSLSLINKIIGKIDKELNKSLQTRVVSYLDRFPKLINSDSKDYFKALKKGLIDDAVKGFHNTGSREQYQVSSNLNNDSKLFALNLPDGTNVIGISHNPLVELDGYRQIYGSSSYDLRKNLKIYDAESTKEIVSSQLFSDLQFDRAKGGLAFAITNRGGSTNNENDLKLNKIVTKGRSKKSLDEYEFYSKQDFLSFITRSSKNDGIKIFDEIEKIAQLENVDLTENQKIKEEILKGSEYHPSKGTKSLSGGSAGFSFSYARENSLYEFERNTKHKVIAICYENKDGEEKTSFLSCNQGREMEVIKAFADKNKIADLSKINSQKTTIFNFPNRGNAEAFVWKATFKAAIKGGLDITQTFEKIESAIKSFNNTEQINKLNSSGYKAIGNEAFISTVNFDSKSVDLRSIFDDFISSYGANLKDKLGKEYTKISNFQTLESHINFSESMKGLHKVSFCNVFSKINQKYNQSEIKENRIRMLKDVGIDKKAVIDDALEIVKAGNILFDPEKGSAFNHGSFEISLAAKRGIRGGLDKRDERLRNYTEINQNSETRNLDEGIQYNTKEDVKKYTSINCQKLNALITVFTQKISSNPDLGGEGDIEITEKELHKSLIQWSCSQSLNFTEMLKDLTITIKDKNENEIVFGYDEKERLFYFSSHDEMLPPAAVLNNLLKENLSIVPLEQLNINDKSFNDANKFIEASKEAARLPDYAMGDNHYGVANLETSEMLKHGLSKSDDENCHKRYDVMKTNEYAEFLKQASESIGTGDQKEIKETILKMAKSLSENDNHLKEIVSKEKPMDDLPEMIRYMQLDRYLRVAAGSHLLFDERVLKKANKELNLVKKAEKDFSSSKDDSYYEKLLAKKDISDLVSGSDTGDTKYILLNKNSLEVNFKSERARGIFEHLTNEKNIKVNPVKSGFILNNSEKLEIVKVDDLRQFKAELERKREAFDRERSETKENIFKETCQSSKGQRAINDLLDICHKNIGPNINKADEEFIEDIKSYLKLPEMNKVGKGVMKVLKESKEKDKIEGQISDAEKKQRIVIALCDTLNISINRIKKDSDRVLKIVEDQSSMFFRQTLASDKNKSIENLILKNDEKQNKSSYLLVEVGSGGFPKNNPENYRFFDNQGDLLKHMDQSNINAKEQSKGFEYADPKSSSKKSYLVVDINDFKETLLEKKREKSNPEVEIDL